MFRPLAIAAALALVAGVDTADAQNRPIVEPGLAFERVYDSNLFYETEEPESDVILRLSPSVRARFESPRWNWLASAQMDAERYSSHPELTAAFARANALVDIRYIGSPRWRMDLDGSFTDTRTPAEFNVLTTGLVLGRIRARQYAATPTFHFQATPVTGVDLTYRLLKDDIVEGSGIDSVTNIGGLAVTRRLTPRAQVSAGYEGGAISFWPEGRLASHLAKFTASYQVTPSTEVTFEGGPRWLDQDLATEVAAMLMHRARGLQGSVGYFRFRTTVLGQGEVVNTESVRAVLAGRPLQRLSLEVEPGVFRNRFREREATVYRVAAAAVVEVFRGVGIQVRYAIDRQHGSLDLGRGPDDRLSHGTLSVALTTRLVRRTVRDPEPVRFR